MGYSVYVQKFNAGEPAFAPFAAVASVLERYGRLAMHGDRGEFVPNGDDICDVGYLTGSEALGLDGVGFDRPVSGGRLQQLVFELLALEGMCYYELDVSYVLARTDVTDELPEGLRELCETGRCTVISQAEEVAL
jgi:hypothetical protein